MALRSYMPSYPARVFDYAHVIHLTADKTYFWPKHFKPAGGRLDLILLLRAQRRNASFVFSTFQICWGTNVLSNVIPTETSIGRK